MLKLTLTTLKLTLNDINISAVGLLPAKSRAKSRSTASTLTTGVTLVYMILRLMAHSLRLPHRLTLTESNDL